MSEASEPEESPIEAPHRGARRFLPPLHWLRAYAARDLGSDAIAGILVAVLLVPQAMAYAMLAELPPRTGLYAAMLPPLLYAVLGTSRFLCVGPVALVSLLVADATARAGAGGGDADRLVLALLLAAMVGLILIFAGLFQLGFLANFLSNPVLTGFTAGAAVLIGASQLGPFLGVELERGQGLLGTVGQAIDRLPEVNGATAILGGACLVALLLAGEPLARLLRATAWSERVRSAVRQAVPLAVVVAAVLAVRWLELEDAGVETVGELGAGLPPWTPPPLDADLWRRLSGSAASVAVVAFVIAVAIAKSLASRSGQRIHPSQEMVALGAANLGAGLTGACPVGGSVSRSALAFSTGAVSPVAQVVCVAAVAVASLTLGPWLADLPRAALAAIILSAVVGMVDLPAMRRVLRISRKEAATLAATFVAVVGFGVQAGIAVGAASALVLYLWRTSRPRIVEEGLDEDADRYAGEEHDEVEPTQPRVAVLRIDESLYFANARHCEDQIIEALEGRDEVERLVLDLSPVGEIDATAVEMLDKLADDLGQAGVEVVLARLREPVRERLVRAWKSDELAAKRIYPTTREAVDSFSGSKSG